MHHLRDFLVTLIVVAIAGLIWFCDLRRPRGIHGTISRDKPPNTPPESSRR
jgi:hypothetical protein